MGIRGGLPLDLEEGVFGGHGGRRKVSCRVRMEVVLLALEARCGLARGRGALPRWRCVRRGCGRRCEGESLRMTLVGEPKGYLVAFPNGR